LFNVQWAIFQPHHGENKLPWWEMMMTYTVSWIFIVLPQLKQQSSSRHVAPIWYIILIPSQPLLTFTLSCCLFSRETTNTNCILWLTQSGLEHRIYHTPGEHVNHYTIDEVYLHLQNKQTKNMIYIAQKS
jgi:hypothetical protein